MLKVSLSFPYNHSSFSPWLLGQLIILYLYLKPHLKHMNRHFPSGPEIPDSSLSAVLLLSADRVKPQLVMWDTCAWELQYVSFSSDYSYNKHVPVTLRDFYYKHTFWIIHWTQFHTFYMYDIYLYSSASHKGSSEGFTQ